MSILAAKLRKSRLARLRSETPPPQVQIYSFEESYSIQCAGVFMTVDRETFDAVRADHFACVRLLEEESGASYEELVAYQAFQHGHEGPQWRCCAITRAGNQCLNHIRDYSCRGSQEDAFNQWLAKKSFDQFCRVHADRTLNVETV